MSALSIPDTPLPSVDTMGSFSASDNFIAQTNIGGKGKIRRATPGNVLNYFLGELGLCLDENGTVCANVE